MERETALIVGAGSGLSASLARLFAREGMAVALAARNPGKLTGLTGETGAVAFACDTSIPGEVDRLFANLDQQLGSPSLVVYNAGLRVRGPIEALDPTRAGWRNRLHDERIARNSEEKLRRNAQLAAYLVE